MSNTKMIEDKAFFTQEVTKAFLKDLEMACKNMELELFTNLFQNTTYLSYRMMSLILTSTT